MSQAAEAVAPLIPAASLILLRDGPGGPELFMVERHGSLAFAPGAMVFPGGRLDPEDGAGELAFVRAAIREAYEEAGLLLARIRGTTDLADAEAVGRLSPVPGAGLFARLAVLGLEPAIDRLQPFARWQTPEIVRRRFDTRFFLARAPDGQIARVDGGEAVAGRWGTAASFLSGAAEGRLRLVFATRMILARLASASSVEAALAAAGPEALLPILPRRVETAAGPVLRLPAASGYRPLDTPLAEALLG